MDVDFWEEVERSRRMTPEQRFRGTLDMIDLVHEIRMAGIRHDLPGADDSEVFAVLHANGWKVPRIWARFDEMRFVLKLHRCKTVTSRTASTLKV